MKSGIWTFLGRAVTGGSAALCLALGVARAENPELNDLRSRIEKLEQENKELRGGVLPAADGAAAPAQFDKAAVEKIVGDYLKSQDDKKKKDDDAKKKELQEKGYEVGSDLKMSAAWNNGLQLQTDNKDFKIHIGGRFDQHWVMWNEDPSLRNSAAVGKFDDGIFFRRIRLQLDGSAYEVYEWNFVYDFENVDRFNMDDFWFGITQVPYVGTVRVGNVKIAQGLESYSSSRYITFMERAAPFDAFLNEFGPGIWVTNNYFDQHMTTAGNFYRISRNADGSDFGDGEWAATGRVTALPWYENDGRCLLHFGLSATWRNAKTTTIATAGSPVTNAQDGEQIRFRARPELRDSTGFEGRGGRIDTGGPGNNNRLVDTGNINADSAEIYGAEALLVTGPFSLQGEYFLAMIPDANGDGNRSFTGAYVQASYFLTGENRAYDRRLGRLDRIKPFTNYWCVRGDDGCISKGIGAWEVAARWSLVNLDDGPIHGGELNEYTLGVNWYLNPNMRIQFNYVHADRSDIAPLGALDGFGSNFQIDF